MKYGKTAYASKHRMFIEYTAPNHNFFLSGLATRFVPSDKNFTELGEKVENFLKRLFTKESKSTNVE